MLDQMFLNSGALINDLLKQIVTWPEAKNLGEVNDLINKLRSFLYELKKLELDFLKENSPGFHLLSSVISLKLPKFYMMELFRKTGLIIVKVDSLFEFQVDLTAMFEVASRPNVKEHKKPDIASSSYKSPVAHSAQKTFQHNKPSFKTNNDDSKKACEFCLSTLHASLHCKKFDSFDKRKARALALGLC